MAKAPHIHATGDLGATVARTRASLQQLSQQDLDAPSRIALEDLATALEELQAGSKDLRQQHEELVHERHAMEGERRRYEQLFLHAPDPYLVTDARGVIAEANLRAAALLRSTIAELRGVPLATRMPFSERATFRERLVAAARGEEQQGWLAWLQPRNAARRAVSMDVCIDPASSQDDTHRLRWLLHDVHEIANRAAELQEAFAHQQLRTTELEDVNRWKTSLLRAAAHDLRAPLATIISAAGTVLEREASLTIPQILDLVDLVERNGHRLSRLLTDLMDLDRLTVSGGDLQREPIEVAALVRRILDDVDMGDRVISTDLADVTAPVGRVEFERIVENLLRNTVAHTAPDTPIWVRLEAGDQLVHLTVEDAGSGVAEADRETIFAPFTRAGNAGPGTGLGLSLVQLFAELHGGSAIVSDRPGGGASFRVSLPTGPQTATEPAAGPTATV